MNTRTFACSIALLTLALAAMPAIAQDAKKADSGTAAISLSGSGKGPIEVRDSGGKVVEVLKPEDAMLNQPTAAMLERQRQHQEALAARSEELGQQRDTKRQAETERAIENERLAEETRVAEEEKARVAAELEAADEGNKTRRVTIRRRISATEPPDPDAPKPIYKP